MSKSKENPELLDLSRVLPTSARDVAALRKLRNLPKMDMAAYLEFLASIPACRESLRLRKGPAGDEPFTL